MLPGGGTMIVVPGLTGSLVSLHASGGTVNWSVSVANDPDHVVSVSPGGGNAHAGDPAITLRVRVSQFVRCGPGTSMPCPAITIWPRGATFAVWTGWTLPFPRGSRRPSAAPVIPARRRHVSRRPACRPAPPYNNALITSYPQLPTERGETTTVSAWSDSEIVASIVAGDPEGLAAAYDRYAGDLFGYCQSLLQDPDDAADAVQDTFVIAVSKLAGLRDPERLRAWLFAVARNECLHRLKSRHAATPLQDAPEPADDSVDVGGEAERAETVALLRAAVGGLNDGERDVINQLWHGLDVPEVAVVLGVSRNHAYSLFSRARDQLEASVAVLLVGRAGRADCATLDSLLGDWDGRLTALLRKRVGRHIDRCPVCSDRRRQELTPALLYGLSPAALLAVAALREDFRAHRRPRGGPPSAGARHGAAPGHRTRPRTRRHTRRSQGEARSRSVVTASPGHRTTDPSASAPRPHMRVHRGRRDGGRGGGDRRGDRRRAAHAAGARPPGGGPTLGAPVPGGPAPAGAAGAARRAAPRRPGRGRAAPAPQQARPRPRHGRAGGRAGRRRRRADGHRPATATGARHAADRDGTATAPRRRPRPRLAPLSAGTLSVSPTTVLLSPLLGGSLTLTASGGPVSWSISEPASLLGELTVSPASGTLSAGGSVTVAITVSGLVSLDTQLTVQPGRASGDRACSGSARAPRQRAGGKPPAAAPRVARSACARRSRTARAGSCAP